MNKLHLLALCLLALPLTGTAQKNSTYTGPSISLNENKMTVTSIGKLERTAKTSFQGMDICGDWLISLEHSGIATVYQTDGKSLSRKGHLTLGSSHRSNHCNSANFSNHKVEAGDPLPLLYVSRCNTEKMADGTDRMVFVERIDPINMKSELVQRVVLQIKPGAWTGNSTWAVDKDNDFLYCLTNTVSNKGKGNRHILQKFRLPAYTGTQDSLVFITPSDALEEYYLEDYYNKPFSPIMQGLTVKNGMLFIPTGVGVPKEPSILYVWDLGKRYMRNEVDLQDAIPSELEDAACRQGSLFLQTQSMGIQRVDFLEK